MGGFVSGRVSLVLPTGWSIFGILGLSHGLAAVALAVWDLGFLWKTWLWAGLALSLAMGTGHFLYGAAVPVALDYSGNGWARLHLRCGTILRARRLDGAFVSPWLVIAHFREELQGKRYICLIPSTRFNRNMHRQLRVLLRHPL
jgi:hypothetical protein